MDNRICHGCDVPYRTSSEEPLAKHYCLRCRDELSSEIVESDEKTFIAVVLFLIVMLIIIYASLESLWA